MSDRRLSQEVIAGVLDDYRSGMSTQAVAANRGVSTSSVSKIVREAGITRPRQKTERKWGPCEVCGKRTRGWINFRCSLHTRTRNTPGDPIGLTGGHWAPVGGIMRWVQTEPPADPEQVERTGQHAAKCGTDSGYHRHVKTTKTPACEPCKEAHRAYQRERAAAESQREQRSAA